MDERKKKKPKYHLRYWHRLPSVRKQEMLFVIDEIIENHMVEFDDGPMGAEFPPVMKDAIAAGYSEALFRHIFGIMLKGNLIVCSTRLIHRFNDIDNSLFEFSQN
jgi:hypothetical protein